MAKRRARVKLKTYRVFRLDKLGEWYSWKLVAVNLDVAIRRARPRDYRTEQKAYAAGLKVLERLSKAEFVG